MYMILAATLDFRIRQLLHCELCQAQQESHDGGQWPRSSQGNSGGQHLRANDDNIRRRA